MNGNKTASQQSISGYFIKDSVKIDFDLRVSN